MSVECNESVSKKKVFACDVCNRVFGRNGSLIEHKYIHSNSKPFECELCGQWFRQNSNYRKHQKLHHKNRSIQCRHCFRLFATQSYLNSHLLSHNNFKSYLCHKCGHTFKYRCDLGRHMKIHENLRSHKCMQCRHAFNDISALRRHTIRVHKNSDKSVEQKTREDSELLSGEQGLRQKGCQSMSQSVTQSVTRSAPERESNESLDLNDSNDVNSVIDYINVCRILPVPLPNHIFEKLVELQKEIAIYLGIDQRCDREGYTVLSAGLHDLNAIISEHLGFKYKINQ